MTTVPSETSPTAARGSLGAGLPGTRFDGCSIEIVDGDATRIRLAEHVPVPHPITLRVFFEPKRALALFRLQATIAVVFEPDGSTTEEGKVEATYPFYLQLLPEAVRALRFDNSSLYFHLADPDAMSLVGPTAISVGNLRPKTAALRAMALLSQQLAFVVRLPPARALQHAQALSTLCEAVAVSVSVSATAMGKQVCADPAQSDLRGLYRGRGGRIIALDEVLGGGGGVAHANAPPRYADVASSSVSLSPGTSSMRKAKRQRSRSPVESEPETHTAKQLADNQRALALEELLRQLDDKEKRIKVLLKEMDVKAVRAAQQLKQMDEQAQRLTELTAAAAAAAGSGQMKDMAGPDTDSSPPSGTRALRPSPSPSDASAAVSTASKISTRIQAYIETQLEGLRAEIRVHNEEYVDNTVADHATTEAMQTYVDHSLADYATIAAMESHVADELDGALSEHVEDFQMYEAITEAVDNAVEGIRNRILAAWDA